MKLTWELVREMRAVYNPDEEGTGVDDLARQYYISPRAARDVLFGVSWVEPGMQVHKPRKYVRQVKQATKPCSRQALLEFMQGAGAAMSVHEVARLTGHSAIVVARFKRKKDVTV